MKPDFSYSLLSNEITFIHRRSGLSSDLPELFNTEKNSTALSAVGRSIKKISTDDLIGVYDYTSVARHLFLSDGQVFRFGMNCRLSTPGLIFLMLKSRWERHCADMLVISSLSETGGFGNKLKDSALVDSFLSGFKPSRDEILKNFTDPSPSIPLSYDEIFHKTLFLISFMEFISLFPDNQNMKEDQLVLLASKHERDEYLQQKSLWEQKEKELGKILLHLEQSKIMNKNIEDKYYSIFGSLVLDQFRIRTRCQLYSQMLALIKKRHGYTIRELFRKASEELPENIAEKKEIEFKISRSFLCLGSELFPLNKVKLSDAEYQTFTEEYERDVIKFLKKIYFLVYPDFRDTTKLTTTQIRKLDDIWLRLMRFKNSDLFSHSPSSFLYLNPDIDNLRKIYNEACEILGISEDMEILPENKLQYLISTGKSISEITDYLKADIKSMLYQLSHLELLSADYTNEQQTRFYRKALQDIEFHKSKLNREISDLLNQLNIRKMEFKKSYLHHHEQSE